MCVNFECVLGSPRASQLPNLQFCYSSYRTAKFPRSGPRAARTILLFHIIGARPSKQPRMVRTFLKVYMELGSYFLFLQERHHHRFYNVTAGPL
jgi:hypothetical protein